MNRPDLPAMLQVGLMAYSAESPANTSASFDEIVFDEIVFDVP